MNWIQQKEAPKAWQQGLPSANPQETTEAYKTVTVIYHSWSQLLYKLAENDFSKWFSQRLSYLGDPTIKKK